jgi:hypothetical protein
LYPITQKKLTAILEAIGNSINSGMVTPTEQFDDKLWQMQEAFFKEADEHKNYEQERIEERNKK